MQQFSLTTAGLVFAALLGLAWQQTLHAQSTATGQPKGAKSPASAASGSSYTTQKTISGFLPPTNQLATDPAVGNAQSRGAPGTSTSSGPTPSPAASPKPPPASQPRSPVHMASAAHRPASTASK